jgi:hypothetical protein
MKVCPRNAKLFDMAIVVDPDLRYLSSINFHCRDQSGNISLRMWRDGFGENLFSGNKVQPSGLQSCPQEHFTGLRIYFSDYVKAVGVICDTVDVTPVAVVPPPIRHSGAARPVGPSAATAIAFAGGWQTVTGQNGHFTVILQISNSSVDPLLYDLYVTGQLINTDGATDYNGTLQGVIRRGTRTLQYAFVQQAINASGTGQFTLSQDGNSISGSGKAGDAEFTWNGTRAK